MSLQEEIRAKLEADAEKNGKSVEEYIGQYEKIAPNYAAELRRLAGLS